MSEQQHLPIAGSRFGPTPGGITELGSQVIAAASRVTGRPA